MSISYRNLALLLGIVIPVLLPAAARADDSSFSDLAAKGKISGDLRVYDWDNHNFYNSTTSNNTFVVGGKLKAESGEFHHFSIAAALYAAHTPGSADNVDPTLGTNINTLGELYLNYRNDWANLRIGRQAIETPFANSADYRMIPALYQGATLEINPASNYGFSFGRINRYKSWTDDDFDQTNNETAGPFKKTGSPYENFPGQETSGFWYASVHHDLSFSNKKLASKLWYYDFIDIARLVFLEEKMSFELENKVKPFIGVQYANEKSHGAALFGTVDSTPYGLQLGADFGSNNITAAVVHIPSHSDAFNNGGLASPYTDGYGSAGLFTANMLFPTEGLGSGDAYQLFASHQFSDSWSAWASYNRFNQTTSDLSPANSIDEYVLSVSYTPSNIKNLKIVDMLGYATVEGNSDHFVQNRLMAQYSF